MSASLQREIATNYYQSTSSRSHSPTRDFYERSADGLLRMLSQWLPSDRGARCLDLACGCGEALYMLDREGFTRTAGVSLSAEEISQAGRFVRGNLTCGDILAHLKATASCSVDFITALNILEHLDKDTLQQVLIESARVLREGGALVAMVPNASSPFAGMTRHWDITHEWSFVPNNFRQLAALTGFSAQVEFRECGPIPHGIKSGIRYLGWRLIRVLIVMYLLIEVAAGRGGIYTMDMLVRLTKEDASRREQ